MDPMELSKERLVERMITVERTLHKMLAEERAQKVDYLIRLNMAKARIRILEAKLKGGKHD